MKKLKLAFALVATTALAGPVAAQDVNPEQLATEACQQTRLEMGEMMQDMITRRSAGTRPTAEDMVTDRKRYADMDAKMLETCGITSATLLRYETQNLRRKP